MKKIYMILGALALTVAVNAQQLAHFVQQPIKPIGEIKQTAFNKPEQIRGYANSALPLKVTQAGERDTTLFAEYEIINQLYMGSPYAGINNPFLIVPLTDTVYYYSDYGKGKWVYETVDEVTRQPTTVQVSDTDVLAYPTPSYGWSYCNPTLSVEPTQLTTKGGTVYNVTFKDYMHGYGIEAYGPGQGYTPTNLMAGYWEPEPLTTCLLITPDATSEETADNLKWIPWDDKCHYVYGTGLKDSYFGEGTVDSMGTILPVPEGHPLWVDTVFVHCVTEAGSLKKAIPDAAELTLTLYPVEIKENPITGEMTQYIITDSIIAQAKATKKVCTTMGQNTFTIPFVFMGKNGFGLEGVKPIVITQRCYAEITGYNESKCDFGVLCDYESHASSGSTFIKKNGKYYNFGLNMDVAFNGYFPDIHMFDDTRIEEVPAEGGYVQMGGLIDEDNQEVVSDTLLFACNISTNFEDDAELYDAKGNAIDPKKSNLIADYEVISGPYSYEEGDEEWFSLTASVTIKVKANPIGEAREEVVFLKAYGASLPIVIKQAPGTVDLINVKAVNDNKTYNIFGVEVNEDYKGVVIKNGKKSIQ